MPRESGSMAQARRWSALASRPRRMDQRDRAGFLAQVLFGASGRALVAVLSLPARKRATKLDPSMKRCPENY